VYTHFDILRCIAYKFLGHRESGNSTISMYDDLKYENNFKLFDYANPDALSGGIIK